MRDFTQIGSRGFFQPSGPVSVDEGISLVAAGIAHARSLGLADIVINTLRLSYPTPTVVERYTLALRVVESAAGTLRVAFVMRPDAIDFQKIGAVMVQNRGIITDTFASEAEAVSWLDSLRMPALGRLGDPESPSSGSD